MRFLRRATSARDQGTAAQQRAASHQDRALVVRLLARDEAAFVSLVRTEHESLVRLALVFVRNRATAEEVAQDTWSGVLAGLAGFEGRSSLRAWIFQICSNHAMRRSAREARSTPFSALGGPDEPAVDAGRFEADGHWAHPPHAWRADTPEQILERAEAVACIGRVLDELPPAQRAVVLLRDVEGLDAAEACGVLQVSEANQRVLLHRGRSKVRRALEKLLGDE